MPGGPVEMANLARQYGGDPGPVVFAQTLRISAIVILVPAALYYLLHETRGSVPDAEFVPDFLGMALLVAGAVATAALFHLCRINNTSAERRVGKECVSPIRSRVSAYP